VGWGREREFGEEADAEGVEEGEVGHEIERGTGKTGEAGEREEASRRPPATLFTTRFTKKLIYFAFVPQRVIINRLNVPCLQITYGSSRGFVLEVHVNVLYHISGQPGPGTATQTSC